jgi:signal transduction histidine kinase
MTLSSIKDRLVTSLKNSIFAIITLFYFVIIGTIVSVFNIDNDAHITGDALLNVVLIISAFYLMVFLYFLYEKYKYKQQEKIQIDLLYEDNLNPYFKNNVLIEHFLQRIYEHKKKTSLLNEQQNKWIHDIKIPLSTLKLFINNQNNSLSEKQIQTLELIELDFENHINKKIMYDKIKFEIDDYKIAKINLYESITKVIKRFRPSLTFKNINVELQVPKDTKIVSDDRTIQYALEQLIDNIIKYAYNDSTVTIIYDNDVLSVTNKGDTISSQDINRVFDHGYTGRNSINASISSTGIGLYMVKKSLNHLMHDVSIESVNHKTTVRITF